MFHNPEAQVQRQILTSSKVIAVVGHSNNPARTSYQISQVMRQLGYKVYPVNPTISEVDGQPSYASLADVPVPIDIVNVFRRSEFLADVVEEAIAVNAKAIWAQLGVFDDEAAARAQAAGIPIVMDTCIKVAYFQLVSKKVDI